MVIPIREGCLEANRPRRLVDLIVDQRQCAFVEMILLVATQCGDRYHAGGHRLREVGKALLRQREDDRYRMELRDDDEPRLIGRVDDVALVDLANSRT